MKLIFEYIKKYKLTYIGIVIIFIIGLFIGLVISFRTSEDDIIIERAKLYLMNKYKVTEEAAHRFLQKSSMNHGMKMVDTARNILNG